MDDLSEKQQHQILSVVSALQASVADGREIQATAHIFFPNDRKEVYVTCLRDDNDKLLAASMLKSICQLKDPDMIVYAVDTWALAFKDDDIAYKRYMKERADGKWPSIKDHPNAQEMLTIFVETKDKELGGMIPIQRNKKGERLFGEPNWKGVTKAGLFTNFFGNKR